MQPSNFKREVGAKLRQLRENEGLSQQEVANSLGWGSHVITGNVENGSRDLKAWELSKLSDLLKISIQELLPSKVTESPKAFVLWRDKPTEKVALIQERKFLDVCRKFNFLEDVLELPKKRLAKRNLPSFSLNLSTTTFSDVFALAEKCRDELGLGAYPAKGLISVLEDEYDIKFVYLNIGDNRGSAACTESEFGKCIMLNIPEAPWRRNFSIAHELFHIITWDEALFEQIQANKLLWEKNEKLANAFAAGLLMPQEQTRQLVKESQTDSGKLSFSDVLAIARDFEVSTEALLWRLVGLNILKRESVETLQNNPEFKALELESNSNRELKDHFQSWRFVRLAFQAYSRGRLSRTKLADYLDTSLVDLDNELAKFGLVDVDGEEIEISNP